MAYLIITLTAFGEFRIVQFTVTNTRKYDHIAPILQMLHWLTVRQRIYFKIVLITYKSSNDRAPDWCLLESHPENSSHPVRYYCSCLCLTSSDMVIVLLVLQPSLCGIGCPQILEMRGLFNFLKSVIKIHLFKVTFIDK